MDISQFLILLLEGLSGIEFVEKVDIQTEVVALKGRVILKNHRFLQVYFNEITKTTAFALIENERRLWGIDYDNTRGWHVHPMKHPETHNEITSKTIKEIIGELTQVWNRLP